ncbi:transporter [Novosphingobium pentaromativorans US6-1]|uniref:Transporter, putative n=2 Tax=Novosphingobium pentaromativorans TaxID=205844 RepID=G6EDK0_9SPHN|nr:transporter [Novosphingobium pentaromativorans US6-1]EHJ60628.1 transporter, putative [Novosphingobium pentaromativorans US6-1]
MAPMKFLLPAMAATLALAGCSGSSPSNKQSQPEALVSLATARSGGVASTEQVYGAVERNAETQYNLVAPVEATVQRIAAPGGTAVSSGDLVVALTPSPTTHAQMTQASAGAATAQQAYERAKRLRADGLASDADVESARSAAANALAAKRALSTQTKQLALRAPGAGYVQTISATPGDLIGSGTTVATISRKGSLRARFGISPALLARLSRSAGVTLQTNGGEASRTVPIVAVDPAVDPQTRLASLYVRLPSTAGIETGQVLSGQVALEQVDSGTTVPYDALLDDGGQPYVYVVKNGVAHRHDVTVGAANDKRVAITKGVSTGDKVVTAGGTGVEDGMKVRTK